MPCCSSTAAGSSSATRTFRNRRSISAPPTTATAKADVLEAQAALEQAKINLDYTEIHSPIDGRIGLANFTVGNLVGPSSGTLATIVSHDPIYVIFQASERDVLDYKRRIAELNDRAPRRRARQAAGREHVSAEG